MRNLREFLFSISPEEASFARRGFAPAPPERQQRLEHIGRTFLLGYHAAMARAPGPALDATLNAVDPAFRGFAFEGAGMALALLDHLTPWRRDRVARFLAGAGDAHAYMIHVGAGWALARLPVSPMRALERYDPLLRWLAIDGYGFHEGYFHWARYRDGAPPPRRLTGMAREVFDQGLGRSLWFIHGADVDAIALTVRGFAAPRRADLWAGIGLASAYAGGVGDGELKSLTLAAGDARDDLRQGAAFAAKARLRAGFVPPHSERACRILCGMSAEAAAAVTDTALKQINATESADAYAEWRRHIRTGMREGASGSWSRQAVS